MSIIGMCRSVVLAATFAVTASVAQAATVATIDITGDFDVAPGGFMGMGSDLTVTDGAFDFQLLGPIDQPGEFSYGASLSVDGTEVFMGSFDGPVGVSPLDFGNALVGFIPSGIIGAAQTVATALATTGSFSDSSILGSIAATVSNVVADADSITGEFGLSATSNFFPISGLLGGLGSSFGSGSGTASGVFALNLSITDISDVGEVSSVPLPASAALLLVAMAGLFGVRRWKTVRA